MVDPPTKTPQNVGKLFTRKGPARACVSYKVCLSARVISKAHTMTMVGARGGLLAKEVDNIKL
jgi:hypothetical protein